MRLPGTSGAPAVREKACSASVRIGEIAARASSLRRLSAIRLSSGRYASGSSGELIDGADAHLDARHPLAALCITLVAQRGVVPRGVSVPDREHARPGLWPQR